ncbi:hypothetical protein MYU51_017813 [Penicillium brevicompactum]|uniref:uncharacterized protein n=1 Tax=Penicillium brevicompactum TaxID=5074 RepID=UPI00253F9BF7|nr:uncharacterized protein N7506_010396 [Penicillium brevicompactum]KAJ5327294.1 hypothetical protein N7506_010396 [Penicillium brevicompactum]
MKAPKAPKAPKTKAPKATKATKASKAKKAPRITRRTTKRRRSEESDGYDESVLDASESEPSTSSDQSGSEYAASNSSSHSDDDAEITSLRRGSKGVKIVTSHSRSKKSTITKAAPTRRSKRSKRNDEVSDKSASFPDSSSFDQSEGAYAIPLGERNALINNLTRERAKRMLESIEVPDAKELSADEHRTAHQLLTRGCMPAIPMHWAKDFSTLPESLFFTVQDNVSIHQDGEFVLKADKGTEFHAICAFRELLKICGVVRDHCNILEDGPERSVQKAIERYIRWALDDGHIRVQPSTTPVYMIHCKKAHEGAKAAFSRAFNGLEELTNTWRNQIPNPAKPAVWPSLMGYIICGPVLSVVTLDSNPNPQTETRGMRLLGQFDLSDVNNDVWNTLALAISVMHIKRTMTKLAKAFKRPFTASIVKDASKCITDIDV